MASFQMRIMAGALPFLLAAPGIAMAQAQPLPYAGTAVTRTTTTTATETVYTRQQIDQLIAPIALYPDPLLTHVLMAATYPQQIIEAAEWLRDPAHAALRGEALVAALQPLPWAPSVKALVGVPQVIVILSQHIEWTQALGIAVAAQQKLVLTRVQVLRHAALRSGRLHRVRNLRVSVRNEVVIITSAEPDRVVVPVYNPVVVYGTWPYRDYPPVFLPPPPTLHVAMVEPGFAVSAGYVVAAPLWSWSRPDWRDRSIEIDRSAVTRITRNYEFGPGNVWQHRGPVVLAAPLSAERETNRTASQVAGTVAPGGAAAVVSLPQRAERLPNLIEMPRQGQRAQERMTGQGMPGTEANRPATAEQRGVTGFGTTRPGEPAGTAAGTANAPEHNRNEATTNQPAGPAGGTTAGMQNRPEHNRSQATTNGSAGQHGVTASPSETGTSPSTAGSTGRLGATTGSEHNRSRTTIEPAGREAAPSGSAASQAEHRRHEPASMPRQTTDESHRKQNDATATEKSGTNEAAGRHAGAAHRTGHDRNETATERSAGRQGAVSGSTLSGSEHHPGSGTSEAAGRHGAAAPGTAARPENGGGRSLSNEPAGQSGAEAAGGGHHRHNQATSSRSQEAAPEAHGNSGERAGTSSRHTGRSIGRQETAGEGASTPGTAHGAAAQPTRGSFGDAGAGASDSPGRAGEAHRR